MISSENDVQPAGLIEAQVTRKPGRPTINGTPMTAAERKRRSRMETKLNGQGFDWEAMSKTALIDLLTRRHPDPVTHRYLLRNALMELGRREGLQVAITEENAQA